MTNVTRSIVRTLTPIGAGFAVSVLAHWGVTDPTTLAALGSGSAALYATVVRLVEQKHPKVGVLLGAVGAPTYPSK